MKNVKEFSKKIKKDLKETNRNSTETITIRLTKDEKKRFKRLAKACKLSQTQLFKKLIQGADLKAIPPAEIYEIVRSFTANNSAEPTAKNTLTWSVSTPWGS